jgi:protein-tyrosine phosphatase
MERYDVTWIEQGILAASSWPEAYLEELYSNFKIKVIINLDSPYNTQIPPELTSYLLPIMDGGVPSDEILDQFLEITKKHEHAHQPILVHCIGGHGRTGTMVAIWGVYTNRIPKDQDPITWIRSKREGCIETPEQEDFVTEWTRKFRSQL